MNYRSILRRCFVVGAVSALAMPTRGADRVAVVATFSVIGDMVARIGGDNVDLKTIVGPGGDCELHLPTAADVAAVARSRAVFINDISDEFEPWLEPLLKAAEFGGLKAVVSRGVRTLSVGDEHPVSGRTRPEALDQHAWLDPRNGAIYVRNIASALSRLDPANSAGYRARAAAYERELEELDAWARQQIAAVPREKRRALTSHDSLQYIASAYGVTVLSVNGWTNDSEPSAAELAKLAEKIRASGVKALFLDSITDPRAIRRIAAETGATIGGTLYGDSLSPAGGDASSYLEMLRHDIATLRDGMLLN